MHMLNLAGGTDLQCKEQHVLPWNYAVVTGTIEVMGICSIFDTD
jgi:hypothetical protein